MIKDIFTLRENDSKQGLLDMIAYIGEDSNKMNLIEIGSYTGESTAIFSKHFANVISIDPWLPGYDNNDFISKFNDMNEVERLYDERVKGIKNIIKIKDYSDTAKLPDIPIHVVYIDGVHTNKQVLKDIFNYYHKIQKGGYICGHDYNEDMWPGVIEAINTLLGTPDKIFIDTSWIFKI